MICLIAAIAFILVLRFGFHEPKATVALFAGFVAVQEAIFGLATGISFVTGFADESFGRIMLLADIVFAVLDVVAFLQVRAYGKALQHESKIAAERRTLAQEEEDYRILQEWVTDFAKTRHDLVNQVRLVLSLNRDGETQAALDALNTTIERLEGKETAL